MEQVQLVQLEKEFVEFLLKFDALVGVFEYALAFGFGKLFQTLTVQFQRFRFAWKARPNTGSNSWRIT